MSHVAPYSSIVKHSLLMFFLEFVFVSVCRRLSRIAPLRCTVSHINIFFLLCQAAKNLTPEQEGLDFLYSNLDLENAKTFKYVQHPKKPQEGSSGEKGGGAADGGAGAEVANDGGAAAAMKVYLTRKEQKRIRRTTRMERERRVFCGTLSLLITCW